MIGQPCAEMRHESAEEADPKIERRAQVQTWRVTLIVIR
jgi:hypothetical protein